MQSTATTKALWYLNRWTLVFPSDFPDEMRKQAIETYKKIESGETEGMTKYTDPRTQTAPPFSTGPDVGISK